MTTHWWYFVSVENKCYTATAVVQMPAVRLALGSCLWRRRSSHGTNPPFMARGREACEVAVLYTLSSSRTGLMSLVLSWWLKATETTTTQHLKPQCQHINPHEITQSFYTGMILHIALLWEPANVCCHVLCMFVQLFVTLFLKVLYKKKSIITFNVSKLNSN